MINLDVKDVKAVQMALSKNVVLAIFYRKLKREKGSAKARVAVAQKLLVAAYHVLKKEERYKFNSRTRIHLGKPRSSTGRLKQTEVNIGKPRVECNKV